MGLHLKLVVIPLLLFVPGKAISGKGDMLMNHSRPLQSCRWERIPKPNGRRYLIHVKEAMRQSNQDENSYCNCTYQYTGSGLDQGDCSISIDKVSEFHFAKWECLLTGVDNSTWVGHLNITECTSASDCFKPYFKALNITDGIAFNETSPSSTNVTCCVDAKSKTAQFDIYMEDRRNSFHHEIHLENGNISSYLQSEETCRSLNYNFTPDDNGKRLVCNAIFLHNSKEYNTTSYLPINIKFGPMLSTSSNITQNVTEFNSLVVEVQFISNPQPNISWYLQLDPATGASFIIHENHTKYKTSLHRTQNDSYSSTLEILNLEDEDYRREFKLILSNPYGTKNVPVQLVNRHSSDIENDTYWIIILTAIGTMIFLVLLASVIFVVVRHKLMYHRGEYTPGIKAKYSAEDENAVAFS